MMLHTQLIILIIILKILLIRAQYADLPCAARSIANRSVVCVCTSDYCDTVIRETPVSGQYFKYTSSEAGQRFNKTSGALQSYEDDASYPTLTLDPSIKFQNISGFGGAVTDAAGITWKNLSDSRLMQNLIESYCGTSGLQYNMLRVPIGGTDFSTHVYAYNESPENDATLSNFTLSYEDYEYKHPMIKACMEAANTSIYIVASTWSPPIWMKTNNNYTAYSRLKKEYLQTYADYHMKFIEKYDKELGVPIWGITTSNEPLDGTVDYIDINNLGWSLDYLGEYIEYNLGPTMRNSTYKDVKIITGDDQRYTISLYWNSLVQRYPATLDYLDGVAVHFYMDKLVPASILSTSMADYPDKFVIATEASSGAQVTDVIKVDWGSWPRAEDYFLDIIEDLNNNVIGWIDWNLSLNTEGGPSWTGTALDAAIIVDAEAGEFIKQPMFYAIGHFSKFVPRDSRRIQVSGTTCQPAVQNVAFLTPENTIVIVLYNDGANKMITVRLGDKQVVVALEEKSFTTIEFNNE